MPQMCYKLTIESTSPVHPQTKISRWNPVMGYLCAVNMALIKAILKEKIPATFYCHHACIVCCDSEI